MNPIFAAALELQAFCRERGFRSCLIGGVAVQRWGEPRLTLAVDLTLLTGFGAEAAYVDALLSRFEPRRPDGREFALRFRVALLRSSQGVPLDISLAAMSFEALTIERASPFSLGAGRIAGDVFRRRPHRAQGICGGAPYRSDCAASLAHPSTGPG